MEKHLKCFICGVQMPTVYAYHKHNVRQHTLIQLSRAIFKLQMLPLPLSDPTSDKEDSDDDDEERKQLELDMADVLDLPIKGEIMDEEVIELGPTENADDLQVQSRLVKNPLNSIKQQSRQIIEVQENNPPPCYINPTIEDPDAIVVKFNQELVLALDNAQSALCTSLSNKNSPNRSLRAMSKSRIDIPDPKTFAKDFKQIGSRSYDKYVMQNVILMETPPKRRRGRPRKAIKSSIQAQTDSLNETLEDEDAELADPPLMSDNEEDSLSASLPNITRSRSGRLIKSRKEDGTFKYYDIPGQENADHEDFDGQSEWKGNQLSEVSKGKYRKKRKLLAEEKSNKLNLVTSIKPDNKISFVENNDFVVEIQPVEVEASEDNVEGMSMPLIAPDETCARVELAKSGDVSVNSFECLLCTKSFMLREDWEKHAQEHLTDVGEKTNIILCSTEHEIPDHILRNTDEGKEDDGCREEVAFVTNDLADVIAVKEETVESYVEEDENPSSHKSAKIFSSNEKVSSQAQNLTHECMICLKKYQSRINLESHIKKYHKDTEWMKYKCATCGKSFGFLLALERHMKEHNPNQKFCCNQCGKVFKSLANLKNHAPLHSREEVYECPYCPKQYFIKYSYEKHLKTHESNPKYHCEVCDRKFIEKKQFELHQMRHQISGSHGRSKDFKCNNCGDIKTQMDLDLVGITDVGHHKTCIVCSKGLYKRYVFMATNHDPVSLHPKNKRQREQCKWCGKYVLNLPRHIKNTHLGNEYVLCDICGLGVTKASLPSHKNRKHGGPKVNCDHCNQTFKNVMSLREHMAKVRKKEDPLKNASKFFKEIVNQDNWKEHATKHKSRCSDCGASHFKTHSEFVAHLDSCRRCSNCNLSTFVSREDFLNHIEICSSGIDVITSQLDSASEQEVVTSIFAIVDGNTCELCGIIESDPESLSQHVSEVHPEALPSENVFGENAMISEAILYACPKD